MWDLVALTPAGFLEVYSGEHVIHSVAMSDVLQVGLYPGAGRAADVATNEHHIAAGWERIR